MNRNIEAAERRYRLRMAGVPSVLSADAAYYLSGGIVGKRGDTETTITLAYLAKKAPDAEHFLPDYREAETHEQA